MSPLGFEHVLLSTLNRERINFFNFKRWAKPSTKFINNFIMDMEGMLMI